MYNRDIEPLLRRYREIYPVLGITGPRQSGKTTTAQKIFSDLPYVSLESLDVRVIATQDPHGFLSKYESGAIFDEIQYAPELLSYLQVLVDKNKKNGRFVITGSQNFALSNQVAQSLSGRVGMVNLLPLSLHELGNPQRYLSIIFNGGYPRLYQNKMRAIEFYPSYIQTYLERDVRQIKNIGDLAKFQNFLKLCAGRVGQLVNLSSLAQDCGISHVTAKDWLTILEASFIIFLLRPYHNNFNKRIIKMPKLFFFDTGLACSLLGLETEAQLETHYNKGALFENLVILEILKTRYNLGLPSNIYFWRDQTGHEIDVIAEWGANLKGIEIKSSSTFQAVDIKNLEFLNQIANNLTKYLIYTGKELYDFKGCNILPLDQIQTIFS